MTAHGHLFVVHGKIEHLVHDAAVVPVDHKLRFHRRAWKPLLGTFPETEPYTWDAGWGRVADSSNWLVKVGVRDYQQVLDRLALALDDIERTTLEVNGGRARPLVAVPVIGIGLGGHAEEQGLVVSKLIASLSKRAATSRIDIALVTPDASVYAACQFARRFVASQLPEQLELKARQLGDLAKQGKLALFLGAGVSIPAGLKSWNQLVESLASGIDGLDAEDLKDLTATDQAQLIESHSPKGFQQRVADEVSTATRPALLHALLASLDVNQVVTTNYDKLFETAVEATNRAVESVMPWSSALGRDRWVLKLHGDIDHVQQIVLTRRHMVRYDAANRPSAAMLQSLFLSRHLLVVGASLTDDNVVRLAVEVDAYRVEYQKQREQQVYGTVLDASPHGDRARAKLWQDQLEWVHLSDAGQESSPRALELLLDRIGFYATRDSAWLLDPRFAGLLASEHDKRLGAQARDLYQALTASESAAWAPLIARLRELGADPDYRSSSGPSSRSAISGSVRLHPRS